MTGSRARTRGLETWVAGIAIALRAATALADTSAELNLCRDYNTPSARRLEACGMVIADPMDAHAQFLGYANRAQAYFMAARGDKAMPDISKAISLEPDNAVGYLIRGRFNYSYFQYDDAIADLSVALKKLPDNLDALNHRASSFGNVGKHELAIADYDAIIRLKPEDASAYYARAFEHEARRDFVRARSDFERSFELDSSLAGDFPASCFDVELFEKRRKLVNWPQCERDTR